MTRHPDITGVILAGGRATRMGGVLKATLPLSPDSSATPLSRILDAFTGRFARCVIVACPESRHRMEPPESSLEIAFAQDRVIGCGPLGGLQAGLAATATPFAFVCGGDMPSLSGPLLDLLADRVRQGWALVPVRRGRPEPLHAIYPVSSLPEVERALGEGIRMMLHLIERIPVDYIREEVFRDLEGAERSFDNINTFEDLRRHSA